MWILIKNGTVINPADASERAADILVHDGVIARIDGAIDVPADRVIDASGCFCMPGLIDLHVHLRDPGQTEKEDIASGGAAALAGGFTTIVAMPNTDPVADGPEGIRYVREKAAAVTPVRILPVGAITKGMRGQELSDIRGMARAGCIALSEDGKSVMDSNLYREAMRIAVEEDMTILAHCEDPEIAGDGVMNDDANARRLGFPGIPNAAEDMIAMRDIMLARETGARLHLCHCSTAGSVAMVRQARAAGVDVSAEVCPHHFALSSDDIPGDDANFKMNPPLRTPADGEALRMGLSEGVMDTIATDHAPHTAAEKAQGFIKSPFGIVGLETAAAVTYTYLVQPGTLTAVQMAERMSLRPAQILGIPGGVLSTGAPADITVFDPRREWTVDPEKFFSKGHNTPFAGRTLTGKVVATVVGGEIAYREE